MHTFNGDLQISGPERVNSVAYKRLETMEIDFAVVAPPGNNLELSLVRKTHHM